MCKYQILIKVMKTNTIHGVNVIGLLYISYKDVENTTKDNK